MGKLGEKIQICGLCSAGKIRRSKGFFLFSKTKVLFVTGEKHLKPRLLLLEK